MLVKILKGNKRFSIKDMPLDKALDMADKGEVKLLDQPDPTCQARTQSGESCKIRVKDGDKYCHLHKESK